MRADQFEIDADPVRIRAASGMRPLRRSGAAAARTVRTGRMALDRPLGFIAPCAEPEEARPVPGRAGDGSRDNGEAGVDVLAPDIAARPVCCSPRYSRTRTSATGCEGRRGRATGCGRSRPRSPRDRMIAGSCGSSGLASGLALARLGLAADAIDARVAGLRGYQRHAISGSRASFASATTSSSRSTPPRPTGATIPNSARWARIELMRAVCWRIKRCRVR